MKHVQDRIASMRLLAAPVYRTEPGLDRGSIWALYGFTYSYDPPQIGFTLKSLNSNNSLKVKLTPEQMNCLLDQDPVELGETEHILLMNSDWYSSTTDWSEHPILEQTDEALNQVYPLEEPNPDAISLFDYRDQMLKRIEDHIGELEELKKVIETIPQDTHSTYYLNSEGNPVDPMDHLDL